MSDKIRVIVNGARGRMGQEASAAVEAEKDMELVARTDVGDDLVAAIQSEHARVVVDFTQPGCAMENAEAILDGGASPVIGTTGFRPEQIETLRRKASDLGRGGLIAPNFAIGAILLMKFAASAVRFFPDVEVIELHHDKKVDAPSGTAIKTIELLREALDESGGRPTQRPEEDETVAGARGGTYLGIPVHSVRLPGFVAHQEVIFGATGQRLTLRHDAPSRSSFMPGVILSVRKVLDLDTMVYGLENILDL